MKTLLITPPLTQLNTPYPATAYLQGFLRGQGREVHQADLGIELINRLFSAPLLTRVFDEAAARLPGNSSDNLQNVFAQRAQYLQTIDAVMRFLRGADPTLATRICHTSFLPRAGRFRELEALDWAFGAMGFADRARHLATLYLEDLTDFIRDTINPHFELIRYAEHLCLKLPEFDPLLAALDGPPNLIDSLMLEIFAAQLAQFSPDLVGFSIPFPGNLYSALKCGQFLKAHHPAIKIAWGGGFVSTELRQLKDPRVFDYVDYILLDQGEPGLERLLEHLDDKCDAGKLRKTLLRADDGVLFVAGEGDDPAVCTGAAAPDYADLPLDQYISLIGLANPMHKLWSDGRWNKLILARGCYWAKCAFCDTSLDYIAGYAPGDPIRIVDHMEAVMRQTGSSGFHFVDEAAPPKLLRAVSEEILRRGLCVSWWVNVRFERSFTDELCALMSRSGCIAISGGMEVVSDRVLKLINKGVTVKQAAEAAAHFTANNIMVHAYLMYGFPSETMQETIDALEIVRQMFAAELIQSAFWHRFAMTIHSPVGINPACYGARRTDGALGKFANNEVTFSDSQNLDLAMLGEGLRLATFNYMHGIGFDLPLSKWFSRKVPKPKVGLLFEAERP